MITMTRINKGSQSQCEVVLSLLSQHTDNTLSARQTWSVERHLAGCQACSSAAKEIQATVQLLRAAPRFDTSDSFMASLHTRLDTLPPTVSPAFSLRHRLRAWLSSLGDFGHGGRLPALSLGLGMAALAIFFFVNKPEAPAPIARPIVQTADTVHVSVAADSSNPFSDPAADNLDLRAGVRGSGATSSF